MPALRVKPTGVYYKYDGSRYWSNAQRLYDGDLSSAPTSQSGAIELLYDLSGLPSGVYLTAVTIELQFNRKSNGMPNISFHTQTGASHSQTTSTLVKTVSFDQNGSYNVAEMHTQRAAMTDAESDALLAGPYLTVTLGGFTLSTAYEISLIFEYEEKGSKIYVGSKNATKAYLGDTQVKAVYVGTKKVL